MDAKKDAKKKFNEILDDFSNAMLVTSTPDTGLHARPMRVAEVGDDSELWFVSDFDSAKVDELAENPKVLVTMQGTSEYLSLTGVAEVVVDRERIKQLWSEPWKIWFPQGKEDPSITLIKVTPEFGEYWDNRGTNRFKYLYEAGKAYFSGKAIDTSDLDNNAKVNL